MVFPWVQQNAKRAEKLVDAAQLQSLEMRNMN
jgi:hypothetical protein